jgi:hypothetical protein
MIALYVYMIEVIGSLIGPLGIVYVLLTVIATGRLGNN